MGDYNGWTNKATWRANMWLTSNDEGVYRECVDLAHYAHKAAYEADDRRDRLADLLSEYAEELLHGPRGEGGWLGDIVSDELDKVDWYEIADALIEAECEDYDGESEEDDE